MAEKGEQIAALKAELKMTNEYLKANVNARAKAEDEVAKLKARLEQSERQAEHYRKSITPKCACTKNDNGELKPCAYHEDWRKSTLSNTEAWLLSMRSELDFGLYRMRGCIEADKEKITTLERLGDTMATLVERENLDYAEEWRKYRENE
jgi:chromosome segregation ATPase